MSFLEKVMVFIAKYELHGVIFWNEDLMFFVNCNDFFAWGCADAEDLNEETFPLLEKAIEDAGELDGALLYCARQRKIRPQGAFYKHLDKKNWHLFDACGEERKSGFGNPEERPN